MLCRVVSVAAVGCLLSMAGVARAADSSASTSEEPVTQDRALAEALFRDGKTLVDDGRIEEACAKFKESQRLDPALGTLLYLATCYAQAGKTASAWAAFQSAQQLAHQRRDKARESIAREQALALESNLSKLQISISIPVAGMQIRVDGRELGTAALSTPLPFDPGTHTIEASAPGKRPWSQTVELQTGPTTMDVRIPAFEAEVQEKPEPAAPVVAPPPKPPESETSSGQWSSILGYASLGVGAAGFAAGTYFGLRAYNEAKDADRHCSGSICDQTGLDGYASAKSAANISNVGFAVGILGAAAGTYLLVFTSPPNTEKRSALWVGGTWGHVGAGGSF